MSRFLGPYEKFDEEIYLRLNPDVHVAVNTGVFRSGFEHYKYFGQAEGRAVTAPSHAPPNRVHFMMDENKIPQSTLGFSFCLETVKISSCGGFFICGWANDMLDSLDSLDLYFSSDKFSFPAVNLARSRRTDVESALNLPSHFATGFWGFIFVSKPPFDEQCYVVARTKSDACAQIIVNVERVEGTEVRRAALCQLAEANYLANPYYAAVQNIELQIGKSLVKFNKVLTTAAVNTPYMKRFGRTDARYKASVIVCLYGKLEYLFLQQSTFSRQSNIEDYEFIYVCNSPEIAESLLNEAQISSLIYGLDITVIILNANAGFAGANNLASTFARSDRILFINPDVFPRDANWAAKHNDIIVSKQKSQTALFGVPLYYDNGSMMHAGMYFEIDRMVMVNRGFNRELKLIRVEHYGKGAPPNTLAFLGSRPVPAVTGAFISMANRWFERLGGFSEEYIFGHYEDADICLKSLEEGHPAWMHDAQLFHLEGKGAQRLSQHEGGAIINRWFFTKSWETMIEAELMGRLPQHTAFKVEQ